MTLEDAATIVYGGYAPLALASAEAAATTPNPWADDDDPWNDDETNMIECPACDGTGNAPNADYMYCPVCENMCEITVEAFNARADR